MEFSNQFETPVSSNRNNGPGGRRRVHWSRNAQDTRRSNRYNFSEVHVLNVHMSKFFVCFVDIYISSMFIFLCNNMFYHFNLNWVKYIGDKN